MGLAWQQGPLAPGAIGRFLVPDPLPERLLFAEPLRRRVRVRFGGAWIADSEDVVLLHEPGRYPVAYFPAGGITAGALEPSEHTTRHRDLGATSWYAVRAGEHSKPRAAWQHTELPGYASELKGRFAFAWRAMDAFYEEDERIVGTPPTPTTASTSARPAGTWSSGIKTGPSPTVPAPWSCLSPGSRPAGTYRVRTSTNRRSLRFGGRRSARTKAWPATTTSRTHIVPPGHTRTPGPRSGGSPA